MLKFMQLSLLATTGICQLASYFKYKKVLPFWDSLLQFYPQKFNCQLRRPKVFIWVMIIATICYATLSVGAGCYQFLKSDPGEAYIKLAEPWSENIREARMAYMISIAYFLPPYINWASAGILFVVATYYLRRGFKDLHNTMASDTQLVNQMGLAQTCTHVFVTNDRGLGWYSVGMQWSQHSYVHSWYVSCYLHVALYQRFLGIRKIYYVTLHDRYHNEYHNSPESLYQHLGKLRNTVTGALLLTHINRN